MKQSKASALLDGEGCDPAMSRRLFSHLIFFSSSTGIRKGKSRI